MMEDWTDRVGAISAGMDYFLSIGLSIEDAFVESVRTDMKRFGKELELPSRVIPAPNQTVK